MLLKCNPTILKNSGYIPEIYMHITADWGQYQESHQMDRLGLEETQIDAVSLSC